MQPGGMAGGLVSGIGKTLPLLSIVLLLASLASAQPYFASGSKLASVSSLTIPQVVTGILTRYFLSKQEE
jgi:hypothetical protein